MKLHVYSLVVLSIACVTALAGCESENLSSGASSTTSSGVMKVNGDILIISDSLAFDDILQGYVSNPDSLVSSIPSHFSSYRTGLDLAIMDLPNVGELEQY